ncbi:MAG: signal peptidase I [Lachnospiraceae bacterium]|nr:signal peptidase I [Lachnospiraceae bacterium]
MEKKQDAFCSLVEELLPLYQEHSIGEDTENIIKEHLEDCPSCQEKNRIIAKVYQQEKNREAKKVPLSVQEQEERGKFRVLSKKLKKRKARNICIGIVAFISLFLIYQMSFHTIYMEGDSMSPTVQDGDYCLISQISYLMHAPRRGDIVLLRIGNVGEKRLDIYRIVGVPGDEIEIADGHLLVNGEINQRYEGISATELDGKKGSDYRITVPEDQYFFLGDHHEKSYDSRYIGCVDRNDIIGKFLTSKVPHLGVSSSYVSDTAE